MKNVSKKISLFVSLLLLASLTTGVSATVGGEDTNQNSATVEVSEMDLITELQSMSDEQLKKEGLTKGEINELRGITYESIIEEARDSSDKELKDRVLTSVEIKTVRNGAITPYNATIASGKVSYTIKKTYYRYDTKKKKTYLTTQVNWKWSKAPASRFTDIVGLTTSNKKFLKSSSAGAASYRAASTGPVKKTSSLSLGTTGASTGTFGRFKISHTLLASNTKLIAFTGYLRTTWEANGKVASVGIAGNYGHSVLSCNPSLSVSASGASISFSPSIKISQGDEASIVVKL